MSVRRLYFPHVIAGEQPFQLYRRPFSEPPLRAVVAICPSKVGRSTQRKHAQALRHLRIDHPAQQARQRRRRGRFVVDQQIFSVTPLPSVTTSGSRPFRRMPLLRSLPKIKRLAVFQIDDVVELDALVGGVLEDVVVEDDDSSGRPRRRPCPCGPPPGPASRSGAGCPRRWCGR